MEKNRSRGLTQGIRVVGVVVMFILALASAPRAAKAFECEDYFITCSTLNACLSVIGNPCGCEGIVKCDQTHPDCQEEPVMTTGTYCDEEEEH